MPIREVDAVDLRKGDVLEDGTRVLDAYDVGDEDGLLARGRWIKFSDGNTGMIRRGEAKYRVRT